VSLYSCQGSLHGQADGDLHVKGMQLMAESTSHAFPEVACSLMHMLHQPIHLDRNNNMLLLRKSCTSSGHAFLSCARDNT
jgi:hypothetical protein